MLWPGFQCGAFVVAELTVDGINWWWPVAVSERVGCFEVHMLEAGLHIQEFNLFEHI